MPRTVSFTRHEEAIPVDELYKEVQKYMTDKRKAEELCNYMEAACMVGWDMNRVLSYAQDLGEEAVSCIHSLIDAGYDLGESHYVAKS